MKTIFAGAGLIFAGLPLIVWHIWTTIIAFESSALAGIATFVFPVLSEFYWFFASFWDPPMYTILGIYGIIVGLIFGISGD